MFSEESFMFIKKFLPVLFASVSLIYGHNPKDVERFRNTGVCVGCDLSHLPEMKYIINKLNTEKPDQSIILDHSNLAGCDFAEVSFSQKPTQYRAQMKYANLRGAFLRDARLEGVNFEGSMFAFANLNQTYVKDCNFDQAKFSFSSADKPDDHRTAATFTDAAIHDSSFKDANLNEVNFANTSIHRSNFDKSSLIRTSFWNSYICDSTFKKSLLLNTTVDYATIINTNFKAAQNLDTVNFADAKTIRNCNFSKTAYQYAYWLRRVKDTLSDIRSIASGH